MKIAMLHTQGGGVAEQRQFMPARALARLGHEVVWYESGGDPFSMNKADAEAWFVAKAAWADVMHTHWITEVAPIQMLVTFRNYAFKALGRSVPLITDCDDDVMNVPTYNVAFNAYGAVGDVKRRALWHFKNSDAMSVTMPSLVERYAPFTREVALLPNCVDPLLWDGLPVDPARASSNDIRIMFAGGIGRKGDLDEIKEALEIVMRARPQVRLFFMGIMPDWAQEQWCADAGDASANRAFYIGATNLVNYRRIMRWIAPDIVVAPVQCNTFNAGKSELKALDAAMAGAAVICSDWPTYAALPGETCLRADTTYEWKESILALVDDASLRQRKAASLLEWVLNERAIDTKVHLWEDMYERALSRPVIGDDGANMVAGTEALAVTEQRSAPICLL